MTDNIKIKDTLYEMVSLLRLMGAEHWSAALQKAGQNIENDPLRTCAEIISMYGGMGSINDIILYRDGQPLFEENNKFDALRSNLFKYCHNQE